VWNAGLISGSRGGGGLPAGGLGKGGTKPGAAPKIPFPVVWQERFPVSIFEAVTTLEHRLHFFPAN